MSKKILLLGSNGLLGSELLKTLQQQDQVVGVSRKVDGFDITKADQIEELFDKHTPDVVINCTAYTNVEGAEEEVGYLQAQAVNDLGVAQLAEFCLKKNIRFIHFSTDYVFGDELLAGYAESDIPKNPLNKYGVSKLQGEQKVIEFLGGLDGSDFKKQSPLMYIVRVSWLFGHGGSNFVQKILQLAEERDSLSVVDDEIGCPTYTKDVATAVQYILESEPTSGVYHSCSSSSCSRFEFAEYILKQSGITTPLNTSKLKDFPRKAQVPHVSILLNTKLPNQRHWKAMVDDFLASN